MEEKMDFAIFIRRLELERSAWRFSEMVFLKLMLQKGGNVPAFIPPLISPPKQQPRTFLSHLQKHMSNIKSIPGVLTCPATIIHYRALPQTMISVRGCVLVKHILRLIIHIWGRGV
jgi:hypothetical protein